jgi:hypothetical protein
MTQQAILDAAPNTDQPAAVLASVARIGAITRDMLRRRDRRHPVECRGWHRPGADPAGQRRPGG